VEIAISYFLEMELLYRRRDSYIRQYPYWPEDSGTYKRLGDQSKKGVKLDKQYNIISFDPDKEYTPSDLSEKGTK
jgi:hypothetical protein